MKKLKRWQIPLYAFASFGPCMLSTIISVYLVDALQTAGFGENVAQWTFASKTIIAVGLFSILKAVSQLMDGITEVPCATIVQNLKTPWGKRRPAILVGTVVMTLAYVLFCFPVSNEENSVANSIYFGILLTVFVSFFTLAINALFGSYAEITANDDDRLFLTNVKAAFDTMLFGDIMIKPWVYAADLPVDYLHPMKMNIYVPGFAEETRRAGYGINMWTINDEQTMLECLKHDAGIITNFPNLAVALRSSLK